MFNEFISYYLKITDKQKLGDVPLHSIIKKIADDDFKDLITKIRQEQNKEKRSALKKQLPAVAVSGIFSDRKTLTNYSGLIQIDFDELTDPEIVKKDLIKDPYTYVAFISPSGNGLKLIVKVPRYPEEHIKNFEALELYYLHKYGLTLDPHTKDITRLMYLSYDPEIYTNAKAKVFYPQNYPAKPRKKYNTISEPRDIIEQKIKHIVSKIEEKQIDITSDYNNWIAIGFALADTLDYDKAQEYFHRISQYYPGYDYHKAQKQFDYCYKYRKNHSTISALFSIAKKHGINLNFDKQIQGFYIDLEQPLPKEIDNENEFGITVQNRSFYKINEGKKKRLSNFAMQILVNIEDNPHNTIKIIKLQRYDWQEPKLLFLRSEKLTFYNIKPVLISSSVTFSGTGNDWNNVLEFLLQRERTVKLIGAENLGWQNNERFYVFANAIVDQQGNIFKPNNQGFLTLDKQTYFLPAFSSMEETVNNQNIVDTEFLKNYPLRLGKIDFSQWTEYLTGAYGEKAYIGILFTITAIFRDIVFNTVKIPYLYLFGEYNTGKTSFILNFLSLFTTDEGTSLSSSTKAILRTPSQVKNSLVYFKEFDKNVIKDIENPLLSLYDGVTRNIAKKTTNNATHKNKVHSLMIFDGNYMPSLKPNLFSRFVIISFDGHYTQENLYYYNLLQEAKEEGLGQVFAEILSKREIFEQNFEQTFKQIRTQHKLFTDNRFDSRVKDHFALFLAVYKTLQASLEFSFTQDELTSYLERLMKEQQDSLNDINDLHVFWEAFNHNISTNILIDDYHYKVCRDRNILAIDYNGVYEKYVEYCKNQDIPSTDKKTIEKLLTSPANTSYIKPDKGKKKVVRFPNRQTTLRALLFRLEDNKVGQYKLHLDSIKKPY